MTILNNNRTPFTQANPFASAKSIASSSVANKVDSNRGIIPEIAKEAVGQTYIGARDPRALELNLKPGVAERVGQYMVSIGVNGMVQVARKGETIAKYPQGTRVSHSQNSDSLFADFPAISEDAPQIGEEINGYNKYVYFNLPETSLIS